LRSLAPCADQIKAARTVWLVDMPIFSSMTPPRDIICLFDVHDAREMDRIRLRSRLK
jgi:hypothetical protein